MAARRMPDQRAIFETQFRVIRILWLAHVVIALALWLGLPVFVPPPATIPAGRGIFVAMFAVVSLVEVAVAWWFRLRAAAAFREMAAPAASPSDEAPRGPAPPAAGLAVIPITISVTPAILGFLLYLTAGHRAGQAALSILSLLVLWAVRPRWEEWEEGLAR